MFKVLEPILCFSCVAAATLLTPRHFIGRVFHSGDLFALVLFILRFILLHL